MNPTGFRSSLYRAPYVFIGLYANLPAASACKVGDLALVTDIGSAGSIWVSDGTTRWYPLGGMVDMFLSAQMPMCMPSSGSIGNNGALSGLTAFAITLPPCYMYFPVNTIAAGVAAGLYYVVMSSTTAGTIYNNTYTSGIPTIPASPTAFSTTGPGAYTQSTSETTVLTWTLPGATLFPGADLHTELVWFAANTAGTKTITQRIGSKVAGFNNGSANALVSRNAADVWNANGALLDVRSPGYGGGGANINTQTLDLTADQTVAMNFTLATATDYAFIQKYHCALYTS